MPPRSRRFQRPLGERRYRKLYIIATEGTRTEPQYFAVFNSDQSVVVVRCLSGKKGASPLRLLKRIEDHLKKESLRRSDEAWLVADKDQWTDGQLKQLHAWSLGQKNYGFALSNPKFEYWLLLHFEDGNGVTDSRDCSERLEKHLPGYDKLIDARKITPAMIDSAIERAERRDCPPCVDWPQAVGTTVYKLVKSILQG